MFEKHCQICDIEVKKETVIKRFGKYFCNGDHVQQYVARKMEEEKRMEEERRRHPRRGGCC
ncbi:MAG TPA: hypothetical protein VJJ25_04805 [Nitrosopumilaceae archaeon]|nr:hypothetical protein [Nitrosopumilaceae archaeon]